MDKKIGQHFMINDGLTEMAANAVELVVDKNTGIAYACYLSSETALGESTSLVKIAKFNIMQPTNVVWATIYDKNVDFNGDLLLECNLIELSATTLRVYCVNMITWKYYFKDVDKKTLKAGELKELKFKTSEDSEVLNYDRDTINEYFKTLGGDLFTNLQLTSPIVKIGDTFYTTSCGGECQDKTLFLKSTDGEVWTIKSIIPFGSNYEAVLCYHDNKFFVMLRGGERQPTGNKKEHLIYSEDGINWVKTNLALECSETRPYLFNYQGSLYLAYSSPLPLDYSTVRPFRCNVHVGKVVTQNGNTIFEEEIYKESKFGIVYYALTDWYGNMIMLYSSGELNPTRGLMLGWSQGKDCLNYTILKVEDPILKFEE